MSLQQNCEQEISLHRKIIVITQIASCYTFYKPQDKAAVLKYVAIL
jgi:hypothetical protein